MAEAVYLLCALTSLACAGLLFRSYLAGRGHLALWTSVCFVGLALNNCLLFIDLVVVPSADLSLARTSVALAGVVCLLFAMITERE